MFRNYIKIAWRNLLSSKFYSLINIVGITIGLVISILLMLWVQDELSFDGYHRNAKNIYKIGIEGGTGISKQIFTQIIAPVATYAKREIPEVKDGVRIMYVGNAPFKYKDKVFIENNFAFTDPSYFSVFDFKLIKGDSRNPFPDNNSIVITEGTARRYFGEVDPIGKVVTMGHDEQCKVTGVIPDYPENSTFQLHVLLPISRFNDLAYVKRQTSYDAGKTVISSMDADWSNFGFETYLLVNPNADIASVEKKLQAIHERNRPEDKPVPYVTQPLLKTHLYKMDGSDGGISVVRMFIAIILMTLVIACINYVNLSTARAMMRAKEVSMRKIIGASKVQLFIQFVVETALLFIVAAIFSLGIIYTVLPYFNQFSGKEISLQLSNRTVWLCIGGALLGTLAASSIYPAMLLSSFKPLASLKGKVSANISKVAFRRVLVVVQFAISIMLIVGTIVVGKQLSYIRQRNIGYDRENVFSFGLRPDMQNHYGAIKNELLKNSGIVAVTRAGRDIINNGGSSTGNNDWDGKPTNSNMWFNQVFSDETFIDFFKIKLLKGSNFIGSIADSMHFVINETAAREMGMKDPIGKRLRVQTVNGTIIGVVQDFHFASMHKKIEPIVFQYKPENSWKIYIKTKSGEAENAIAAATAIWKRYNNDIPFEYAFLDDSFNKLYSAEQKQGAIFKLFAIVAIIVSCLGLFGLATYTTQVKAKEIGIRKILGASVLRIVRMLSAEFLLLIIISNLVAVPIAWYFMTNWLNGFAYRTTITVSVFLIAGIVAFLIAMTTISFQAIKTALANPIKSLRTE